MEKSYIVQGKGLEEALGKGAAVLACAREHIAFEILQEARPGRYGQPGTPCKLRVTPIAPSVEEATRASDDAEGPPSVPLPWSWSEMAAMPSQTFLAKMEAALATVGASDRPSDLERPTPDGEPSARREIAGNVSLATGSVRHTGDVYIHGSVHKGLTVQATGSIHVVGSVETAFLDAGRDIVIDEGLYGTVRSASGHVRCRFAQGAQIKALRGDVTIAESALHCQIHAGRSVSVGGLLLGGTCYGEHTVKARVAGAQDAIATALFAGRNRRLYDQIEHVRQRALRCVEWLRESEAVRNELLPSEEAGAPLSPEDRARLWQAQACRMRVHADLRRLAHQKSRFLGMINAERSSRISILDRVYPNVRLSIDDAGREIQKLTQFATFTKDYEAGELRMTSYQ